MNGVDPDAGRPLLKRLDSRYYGDGGDDVEPSELHGVAPPCDRCGEREAVTTLRGGRDMCDDCAAVVAARERFLSWLTPTQRGDYRAVVIDGVEQAERADERDVDASVVSRSVSRASDRLQEIAEQRGEL